MAISRAVSPAAASVSKQHDSAGVLRQPQIAIECYGVGGNVNQMLCNDWLCEFNHRMTSPILKPTSLGHDSWCRRMQLCPLLSLGFAPRTGYEEEGRLFAYTAKGKVSSTSPASHSAVASSGLTARVSSKWSTASNWSGRRARK